MTVIANYWTIAVAVFTPKKWETQKLGQHFIISWILWYSITLVQRFQEYLVDRLRNQCPETWNRRRFIWKGAKRIFYPECERWEDLGLSPPPRLGTCGSIRGPVHTSDYRLSFPLNLSMKIYFYQHNSFYCQYQNCHLLKAVFLMCVNSVFYLLFLALFSFWKITNLWYEVFCEPHKS